MLLNIYLGTTAISFATAFIFGAAWEEKLINQTTPQAEKTLTLKKRRK